MFAYESLEIWKLAVIFAREIYKITNKFPRSEVYGLTNQLRRAVVSISANIAEGSGATGTKDKLNYLDIAIKSALEVTSELRIAFELNYIDQKNLEDLYNQAETIIRKIRAFKKFLKNDKL